MVFVKILFLGRFREAGEKRYSLKFFINQITNNDCRTDTHLLFVDNIDPCLDVREGMRCCEDGFAFILLVEVAVGSAVQSEGSTVHEGTQVVVLVKVGDSFL